MIEDRQRRGVARACAEDQLTLRERLRILELDLLPLPAVAVQLFMLAIFGANDIDMNQK